MTCTRVLVTVVFYSSHRLAPLLSGGGLFPLALDGRLFVRAPPLHLLEQAVLQHLFLQGPQGRFDLVVDDDDPCRRDGSAHRLLTCEVARLDVRASARGAPAMA